MEEKTIKKVFHKAISFPILCFGLFENHVQGVIIYFHRSEILCKKTFKVVVNLTLIRIKNELIKSSTGELIRQYVSIIVISISLKK